MHVDGPVRSVRKAGVRTAQLHRRGRRRRLLPLLGGARARALLVRVRGAVSIAHFRVRGLHVHVQQDAEALREGVALAGGNARLSLRLQYSDSSTHAALSLPHLHQPRVLDVLVGRGRVPLDLLDDVLEVRLHEERARAGIHGQLGDRLRGGEEPAEASLAAAAAAGGLLLGYGVGEQ